MCGIAGGVGIRDPQRLHLALHALLHRGPDGIATISDGPCMLGQTRLSIIDLSPAGQEPFVNENGTVWLTFNGEIYNFKSLRRELEGLGHRFSSKTDAEVVLHGYEEWGVGCLERLRGMFAFAIWDAPRQSLLLARDRVGKKPLFFSAASNALFFASEIQGLLTLLGHTPDVELDAIDHYLSWGYIPAPLSGFAGISKLPPAHYMTVDVRGENIHTRTERYWDLAYEPKEHLSVDDAAAHLRELLTEAVKLRLVSDVPLGAFLSGGIDSSVVVGLMAELSGSPVKTFSIGFSDDRYSELTHARRIADRWSTDHQEFVVEPDALSILPTLARHLGEPFADSSCIPTYYVAKATSDHVTVALNGDGGDESFGGYERYWANTQAERIANVPGSASVSKLLSALLPEPRSTKGALRKIHRFMGALASPQAERYARWMVCFSPEEKKVLLPNRPKDAAEHWLPSLFGDGADLHPIDAAMAVDVRSYLPFDLLMKVDITAMASSLECRSPFLDQQVMEFAARLPVDLKIKGRTKKYLLRKAFADLLPEENVSRPKMGFAAPVDSWLRGPLREYVGDLLLSDSVRAATYLDRDAIRGVVSSHLEGRERSAQVWSLLMLELWLREVVEPVPITPR